MILNRVEWGEKQEIRETEVGNAISSLPCFVLWNLQFQVLKPKRFLKHIFLYSSRFQVTRKEVAFKAVDQHVNCYRVSANQALFNTNFYHEIT